MDAKWKGRTTATAIVASAEQVTTTGTGADTTMATVDQVKAFAKGGSARIQR